MRQNMRQIYHSSPNYMIIFVCILGALSGVRGRKPSFLSSSPSLQLPVVCPRGGGDAEPSLTLNQQTEMEDENDALSLDEKVHRAMKKLGLDPSVAMPPEETSPDECIDGVCPMPHSHDDNSSTDNSKNSKDNSSVAKIDAQQLADTIAQDMGVDTSIAMAAIGATKRGDDIYDEDAARNMIQYELEIIAGIPEDSPQVQELVAEGYDLFLSRRALAFADSNLQDARAILVADQMDFDEEEARSAQEATTASDASSPSFRTVDVDSNFDPSKLATTSAETNNNQETAAPSTPTPARKQDVVFEASADQIQELVLESPVPVLLDIYADWCGPCKVLGPALEEMAVKSGGIFRLVKVNSDNEKAVSGALEVTALPTVFGIRNGKIVHMFQGMPRSQEAMQNFMAGLMIPGEENNFNPPITDAQQRKYKDLTSKLVKMAGAACFPFSARERLQERLSTKLDELYAETGDILEAEESVQTVRSLLSNVIGDPYSTKFRTVNLQNKVIAAKVAKYSSSIALLRSSGFAPDGNTSLVLGKGKRTVNVAPLTVARDTIDKWIDQKRFEVAAATRKRNDEEARDRLQAEGYFERTEEEEEEEPEEEVDPSLTILKVRLDGKKKVHEISIDADKSVKKVLKKMAVKLEEDEEAQITCVAKKLVIKSTDKASMKKSFRELGLYPSAALVIKRGSGPSGAVPNLVERASAKKKLKKGSHTMQSVGIYSTEDNAKGELIDGGGGVLYEHDVSDDEPEEESQRDGGTDAVEEDDADE